MQLKLQRSQRAGGITASTVYFCLDVRADYTADERADINRYRLGPQAVYNSRAAQRHLEAAGTHLDRTQEGSTANRMAGLARGAMSMALAKMQLNITIASLGRGHHIECKDLEELLESEDAIRTACKNLTRFLEVASTFDGSEIIVEYMNGEEKVHIAANAPPLLEDLSEKAPPTPVDDSAYEFEDATGTGLDFQQLGKTVRRYWDEFRSFDLRMQVVLGLGGAFVLVLLLRAL